MTAFVEYQPKTEMKKSPGRFFEPAFIVTTRYGNTASVSKVPLSAIHLILKMVKEKPEYLQP